METCYRHPGRETGVSCSNCSRPICPDCMTSTPVGMRCPECARQKTQVRTIRSLERDPTITYAVIGICVVAWLGSLISAAGGGTSLNSLGAVSRSELAEGEVWRLVTSGFLHDARNPIHLLFNMLALWILGGMLEPAVGRLRFALIFAVSLLAGSFGAVLLEPVRGTVGASGAVFGLMGAAIVVMRNRGINPMESGLALWLGLNLLITFTIPTISIGGHLGGLAGGVLAALVLFELGDRVRGIPRPLPAVLTAAIGVLAVVGALGVSAAG